MVRFRYWCLGALALGSFLRPQPAAGEGAHTSSMTAAVTDTALAPPVDSLVVEALRRAPAIQAVRARVTEARERVSPAGALPNPMVELMVQDIGFPDWTVGEQDMSMIGPQVSQGIPFPGKRGAARDAARAFAAVRDVELEQARREVARDVRLMYARLYAIDAEIATLNAGRELTDMLRETVAARYAAGEAEQEAVIKTQLTLSRLEEKLAAMALMRHHEIEGLNRLLDRPGHSGLGRVTALPEPRPQPVPWDSLALDSSTEVRMKQAEVDMAEKELRMAKLDLKPDFLVGAGIGFRGRLDPAVQFRLGVELPLWRGSRQKPLIRAAEARKESARHELRDAEAMIRAQSARLEAEWTTAETQLRLYREGIIPQTSQAFDAARSAYLTGRGDFSTVIEDLNMWLEARSGLAQRESERFSAWAELESLVAGPVQQPDDIEGDRK